MKKHFDVICIGTGGAGNTAAFKLASEGKEVLICDDLPYGGTCAISGCDPKKIMITATEFSDFARRLFTKDVLSSIPQIDWKKMMEHKREFTQNYPDKLAHKYHKAGITHVKGRASFVSENILKVGDEEFTFDNCLIGTGSKPVPLPFEGAEHIIDNAEFLDLDDLPERILFVGGGYISIEFANIASAFGAVSTIVQLDDRLVPAFDKDIVEVLTESLSESGVNVICNTKVLKVEKMENCYKVTIDTCGIISEIMVNLVVHGAGRMANTDGLNCDLAGVEVSRRGIVVNDYMQTTNPKIYAAGDCSDTEGYTLSPIAFMEGYVAANNMLKGNYMKPDYKDVATVMFNVPSVASIGHTEESAEKAGLDFTVKFKHTDHWFTSFRVMEKFSAFKLLQERGTGKILGVHIIGPHAEDIINVFAVAIKNDIPSSQLKKIIYAYPTATSDIIHLLT
jgi:glutathione reductase (NADPH)